MDSVHGYQLREVKMSLRTEGRKAEKNYPFPANVLVRNNILIPLPMGFTPELDSQRFYRDEHLKKKKRIDLLFMEGTRKKFFPLVLLYRPYTPEDEPFHQVLISIPKKHFRKSVVRNKVRRRIREAYRKHKAMLYNNIQGLPFLLGYVYLSKTVVTYAEIEKSIVASIRYLIEQNNQRNEMAKS
jgi:ribonuclease P protein component